MDHARRHASRTSDHGLRHCICYYEGVSHDGFTSLSFGLAMKKSARETGKPSQAAAGRQGAKQTLSLDAPGPARSRDDFARRWGYDSYLALFEASTPMPTSPRKAAWYVTPVGMGKWIAWNEQELAPGPTFDSKAQAVASVAEQAPPGEAGSDEQATSANQG